MQQAEGRQNYWTGSNPHWEPGWKPAAIPEPAAAESLPALIHDTRNMVASMELYCDLLEEQGVLAAKFRHYAAELRLISGAGRRLLERLSILGMPGGPATGAGNGNSGIEAGKIAVEPVYDPFTAFPRGPVALSRSSSSQVVPMNPPVSNLAEELQANRSLLCALVGPGITVGLSLPEPASAALCTIAMAADNLTRILINLARNAASAMPSGGHIQIDLVRRNDQLQLTFADTGPGISETVLDTIFSPGYTTKAVLEDKIQNGSGSFPVHGLGLAIVRALVQAAGGSVHATNRTSDQNSNASSGATIVIRFPLKT